MDERLKIYCRAILSASSDGAASLPTGSSTSSPDSTPFPDSPNPPNFSTTPAFPASADATIFFSSEIDSSMKRLAPLDVALRLIFARRYDIVCQHEQALVVADSADLLAGLSEDAAREKIRELLKVRETIFHREFLTLERVLESPDQQMKDRLSSFINGFSDEKGERLRTTKHPDLLNLFNPSNSANASNTSNASTTSKAFNSSKTSNTSNTLHAGSLLRATLESLIKLDLHPQRTPPSKFFRLLREVLEFFSPQHEDQKALCELLESLGIAGNMPHFFQTSGQSDDLEIEMIHSRKISWAMEHNGVPLIHQIRLKFLQPTIAGQAIPRQATMALYIGPDLSDRLEFTLTGLQPGKPIVVDRPDLHLDARRLRAIVEKERAVLHLEITSDDRPLFYQAFPVDVLAYNEWDSMLLPELLASFVTPNDPAVAEALPVVSKILNEETGDSAFPGYQCNSRERVLAVIRSVYQSLNALDITYILPPAAFEASGQKVRFPAEVMKRRMGTCLDLCLFMASILEQIGLHPWLILFHNHAAVGCRLTDEWLSTASTDSSRLLRSLIASRELVVFDSSAAVGKSVSFESAREFTEKNLGDEGAEGGNFHFAIDIKAARLARILPLPLRQDVETSSAWSTGTGTPASGTIPVSLRHTLPPATPAVSPSTSLQPSSVFPSPLSSSSASPLSPPEFPDPFLSGDKGKKSRVDVWRERLLDLSLRNRLLNYRESKERSIKFEVTDVGELENRLSAGESLTLEPRVTIGINDPRAEHLQESRGASVQLQEQSLDLLKKSRLLTGLDEKDLMRRLQNMSRFARSEIEESGSSTLYLAIGMLKWFESDLSEVPRFAPILLYPVAFERGQGGTRFRIAMRDDEPRLNETLLEKFRLDHQIDLTDLATLPTDDSGVDVKAVFDRLRIVLKRFPLFEVLPEAHLAFFSFAKFLMWVDLSLHRDDLQKNRLVRHLLGASNTNDSGISKSDSGFQKNDSGLLKNDSEFSTDGSDFSKNGPGFSKNVSGFSKNDSAFSNQSFADISQLDAEVVPSKLPLVLDADSSQLTAVESALRGSTFVIQGPPGTGKSQTIANIIAACLSKGKTVLFIAEKKAALDVVATRLKQVGLADAALELHSNKAVKREIALELARVLESGLPSFDREEYTREIQKLETDLAKLGEYKAGLHHRYPVGASAYEGISRICFLRDAPRADLRMPSPLAITSSDLESQLEHVQTYQNVALDTSDLPGHPLRNLKPAGWSPLTDQKIREAIALLKGRAEDVMNALTPLFEGFSLPNRQRFDCHERLLALLNHVVPGIPDGAEAFLGRSDLESAMKRVEYILSLLKDARRTWETLADRYERTFLDLPLDQLFKTCQEYKDSFVLIRWWNLRSVHTTLSAVAKAPLPELSDLMADITTGRKILQLRSDVGSEQPFLIDLLGAKARGADTDETDFTAWYQWISEWITLKKNLVQTLAPGDRRRVVLMKWPGIEPLVQSAKQAITAYRQAIEHVRRTIPVDEATAFGGSPAEADPHALSKADPYAVIEIAERWLCGIGRLREWSAFFVAEERVGSDGHTGLMSAVRSGRIASDQIKRAFERTFWETWTAHAVEATSELKSFDRREQKRLLERFIKRDRSCINASGTAILERISHDKPNTQAGVGQTSEVGILLREARKKRGHLPVRRLLDAIPNLLPRLKPCLLMSPLSIAQFLPASGKPFDVVIFDEASQIPTHDAIGAIARGTQVIIVGDPKQLPPTSFFEVDRSAGEEAAQEDENVQELESILDECSAAGVPSLLLQWHYRSRDESLIAFSNWHYYENRLATFPSPDTAGEKKAVSYTPVAGIFDRSKARTNVAEARAIADWIKDALLDPRLREHSIGVVTFNQPQQTLIEDLLDEKRAEFPEIDPFFTDQVKEPVFVKNLENVQGDERDIMLFSITYGPDSTGKVTMNFGPLNRQGGERRLNVAVTRARESLKVFSSLTPEMMNLSRTQATGVRHLHSFLRYARDGATFVKPLSGNVDENRVARKLLEDDIAEKLVAAGYKVARDVGMSDMKVDLAIRHPDRPETFALGILCDGAGYAAIKTVRDRERLRTEVLKRLGWNLHRIWSVDWWLDSARELNSIGTAFTLACGSENASSGKSPSENASNLMNGANFTFSRMAVENKTGESISKGAGNSPETLKNKMSASSPKTLADNMTANSLEISVNNVAACKHGEAGLVPPQPLQKLVSSVLPTYVEYFVTSIGSQDSFFTRAKESAICVLMSAIVTTEGPIHCKLLYRKTLSAFNFTKLTAKAESRLVLMLDSLLTNGTFRRAGDFLDLATRPDPFVARGPTLGQSPTPVEGSGITWELRDVEHLPPSETSLALELVLKANVAMSRGEIIREASGLMGYKRVTPKLRESFETGISFLRERRGCQVEGDLIKLP
ncbi:MAG: DUF3320 domain-containing protein [Candidatus Ozemobacteraceae bacterium]